MPMPSLRLLPLPTMEAGDTEATTARGLQRLSPTTDGVDIMARDPPRLSPIMEAGVMGDTTARGVLRPNPTMEAGVMVDTMARGQPRLSLTMDGVVSEDTTAKGPLRL